MGVLKSLRHESVAQFLINAENLRTFTAITITKLSNKYKEYNLHAYRLAQLVLDDLIRANSLYLSKDRPANYQARQTLFDKALGNLNCLSNHIVFLCELADTFDENDKKKKPKITDKRWLNWASMINKTKTLIQKVKDSDTQRIKQAPNNLGA